MIEKLRLISNFMTSQTEQQIITIHILPSISRSKDNQAMRFGQLIKDNVRNIFAENYTANEAGRLVPDLFLCFKKVLFEVKASGQPLSFKICKKNFIKFRTVDQF